MWNILEAVTPKFLKKPAPEKLSSKVDDERTVAVIDDDKIPAGAMSTQTDDSQYGGFSTETNKLNKHIQSQINKIDEYSRISKVPEVKRSINEITNEAVFTPNDLKVMSITINETNKKLMNSIVDEFDHIQNMLDMKKNGFMLFSNFFTYGQLNIHCPYGTEVKEGIKALRVMEPRGLHFNTKNNKWTYMEKVRGYTGSSFKESPKSTYDVEEVVRIDSGSYENNIILSELEDSIKPVNMLVTAEDMLIPMRFSRSVSRRVFNVDTGDIPNSKVEEEMRSIMNKYKYNKYYDVDKGTVTNQRHVAALTEDYWFANKNGAKGTEVDTLDESGNLGELGDIMYLRGKVYDSLQLPSSRRPDEDGNGGMFDGSATEVNRDEVTFFAHVQRLRCRFIDVMYELLKRQVISKEIMTVEEYAEYLPKIELRFSAENVFYENLEAQLLEQRINAYQQIKEDIGKTFSFKEVNETILKRTPEEFEETKKQIALEKKDKMLDFIYNPPEDGY